MPGIDPATVAKAMTDPRFAALARTELSISQIGTWDADLPRDPRLIVPIDVQALAVPDGTHIEAVATATAIPDAPPGSPAADVLPRPPAPLGPSTRREPGIHLHWAMPDGLTRGDAGTARAENVPAGNPTSLPPLPDRWVVVRFLHGTEQTRSWVLEADRGEHHDLDGWTEPGPLDPAVTTSASGRRVVPRERLTAVSGGDPAWAATYDAVRDRFAFHDDLADVDPDVRGRASLSYLVAGWWSDPPLDPLHDVTSAGSYHARLDWLRWLGPDPKGLVDDTAQQQASRGRREAVGLLSPLPSLGGLVAKDVASAKDTLLTRASGTAEDQVFLTDPRLIENGARLHFARGPAAPCHTLLHGSVLGVTVDPGELVDLAPPPSTLQTAVGYSGFSALAAMLADGSDAERTSVERVLAAFSSGLLATIDGPGGLAAVDEDRHAAGFTATAPGTRARPDRIAEGDVLAVERPAGPIAAPRAEAASLGSPVQRDAQLKVRLLPRGSGQVLAAALRARFGDEPAPARPPRTYRDVAVPAPRAFLPTDLTVVLRGANRSPRHGQDGRYTPDGRLACRLPSDVVTGLRGVLAAAHLPAGLSGLGSGAIPSEIDALVRELALTDPYRWPEAARWAERAYAVEGPVLTNRLRAEAVLRHAALPTGRGIRPELDDSVRDVLRRASLTEGVDVSPVGVTRWAQPWVPLWLDWEVEIALGERLGGWVLGPTDLEATPEVAAAPVRTVRGRTLLTSSSAQALTGQIDGWLSEEHQRDLAGQGTLGPEHEAELATVAAAAGGLDVLTGTLQGIRETLLGLDPLDASRVRIAPDGTPTSSPSPVDRPVLLAGGQARIARLRVVDAFGRFVDVPEDALAVAEVASPLRHPDGAPALRLAPRLQRPSRLALRFVDPRTLDGAPAVEALVDQQHPDLAVSPLAGWLLPDHVDEALEVFDAAGAPLGQLMHDELTSAVVWEGAPGRPGPAGGPPDPGDDPGARHVTRFAAGCVEADARARSAPDGPPSESALAALLRAVDTTLWTVDPLGSLGTGAVAGLVGRPVAVVRATLRLDVFDDLDQLDFGDDAATAAAARAERARAYTDLVARAVTVRLGELTRSDDGLIAYAIDDDYAALRLVAPEVRTDARASGRRTGQLAVLGRGSQATPEIVPIEHPYLAGPTDVALTPGHTVALTLFMTPGGRVHATTGLLPRKALALARDWFHDSLVRLSPSFRFGPVLVDPATVRLPLVTGLGDTQVWTRRDTPLTWRDDPIAAATQTAYLPEQPSTLQEGWIRVQQEIPPTTAGGT